MKLFQIKALPFSEATTVRTIATLCIILCAVVGDGKGSAQQDNRTSTTAELDLSFDILLAQYYHGAGPQWLWDLSISANTVEISPENDALREKVAAEVLEIKLRHFVDPRISNSYLAGRESWAMWIDHRMAQKGVTTASLAQELTDRLKQEYVFINLPVRKGTTVFQVRSDSEGFSTCFATLRDLGVPVILTDSLHGELIRSYAALYKEGTNQSWRRFLNACHAARPGPGAVRNYEFGSLETVFVLVESVPPKFLDRAKVYLESLTPCVGSPWWMSTEWGKSYRNLRTRREIHFPGSEGESVWEISTFPSDKFDYCEECGFTTASLNCAKRAEEMRENKSRE